VGRSAVPHEPGGDSCRSLGADAKRLDALLIVMADHELNIATFTARCIASAGSNLYQAMIGGLAALQGYKHLYGQVTEARRFFGEVLETGDPTWWCVITYSTGVQFLGSTSRTDVRT